LSRFVQALLPWQLAFELGALPHRSSARVVANRFIRSHCILLIVVDNLWTAEQFRGTGT
jgi:hypothetical protein